jgi:small-conductance mechanosensitive channel
VMLLCLGLFAEKTKEQEKLQKQIRVERQKAQKILKTDDSFKKLIKERREIGKKIKEMLYKTNPKLKQLEDEYRKKYRKKRKPKKSKRRKGKK